MKWTFLIGLVLGLVAGYYLGQDQVRDEIKSAAGRAGSEVQAFLRDLVNEIRAAPPPRSGETASALPVEAATRPVEPDREKQEYIRAFIEILEREARIEETQESGPATVITGSIRNSGERILQRVEATVFFLGDEGIISESRVAVFDSREAGSPLQPDEDHSFSLSIPRVPFDWVEGRIRMSITDVAFQF